VTRHHVQLFVTLALLWRPATVHAQTDGPPVSPPPPGGGDSGPPGTGGPDVPGVDVDDRAPDVEAAPDDPPGPTPIPPDTPPPDQAAVPNVPPSPSRAAPRHDRRREGPHQVRVHRSPAGWTLRVDGADFMVFGMNWDYLPIGENYTYDFWNKSDRFIAEALRREMTLLREMGVNTIRQYIGIPPKWIEHIYRNYGIYTVLNHPMGRYGHNIDGVYRTPTNYADPRTREVLLEEIRELARQYQDTPGLLMWLLGNENNYGLYWSSNEIENLPEARQGDARAVYLYSLFGEAIDALHDEDRAKHPVAIANGDLGFLEVIKEQCPNLDVMGSNVYRGPSSRDLFDRVADELGVPFMYTEFGSDAYNAREGREDDLAQAEILVALWEEIYQQTAGKGRAQNAIGGLIFQWADGWWKYQQDENLDIHDETASWSNAAYAFDYVEGENNMNEEWFGICAKGRTNPRGFYDVYCRTAYYSLKEAFKLDPYAPTTTSVAIRNHFGNIRPRTLASNYAAQSAINRIEQLEFVRSSFLRMDFETYSTGGLNLNEPSRDQTRFDHLESFYFGFEIQPAPRFRGNLTINALGNVPVNPIDEIFFENRGNVRELVDSDGEDFGLQGIERVKVYQASFEWDDSWFKLEGYYRTGHYHWGYEGDFFGLYPEAYYQEAVDAFNANVPIGIVLSGKKELEGLKVAFGPEIYWGANPTIIAKYYRQSGPWSFSLMHQEDIAQRASAPTSSVIPIPQDRRSTLYLSRQFGPLTVEIGGIMAGSRRIGQDYQRVEDASDQGYLGSGSEIIDDQIDIADTFGAKAKLTLEMAPFYWYLQGGYRGLVTNAGYDPTITFTGWSLKETGLGNHWSVLTGAAYNVGDFQFAPNVLIQQPLEGPLPRIDDAYDPNTGEYFPGVRARNQLADPFWVRDNRETYGFELLIAYDPTPATWMWAWDAVRREDAPFAAALNATYRIHPTSQDAAIGVTNEGFNFAFPSGAPARNLWDVNLRTIQNFGDGWKLVNRIYVGEGQANGDDERLVLRYGTEGRLTYERFSAEYFLRVNDWGPFDYYRDFNFTFPLQTMLNLSYSLGRQEWFVPAQTRFGVRTKFRTLNDFSSRFAPQPDDPDAIGIEWEIKTYVQVTL